MSKRLLWTVFLVAIVAAGVALHVLWTPEPMTAAAGQEDCGAEPPPQTFAMATECGDSGADTPAEGSAPR